MHPECPERVEAIMERLRPRIEKGDLVLQTFVSDPPISVENPIRSWTLSDGDTYSTQFTPDILTVSQRMISAAVNDILHGNTNCAFVLCRPPGHHASSDGPSGFCHINNVWTAVQNLHIHNRFRIGIYDWDVHHGDGTEHHIENAIGGEYDSIRFVSTHAYGRGIFPGTGAFKQTKRILDIPLPQGTLPSTFLHKFENAVIPFLQSGGDLDILIVSAGYDAHEKDPMDLMKLHTETYEYMASALKKFNVPILFLLEGGYTLKSLADSVLATLTPFMSDSPQ